MASCPNRRLVAAAVVCAALSGCGGHAKPPAGPNIARDRSVAAHLRQLDPKARNATAPLAIDLRQIAPFRWTRMFVFAEGYGRTQMRRVIARELGFSWKETPARAAPIGSAKSLLVF